MEKSMYSLMLVDQIVQDIDRLAYERSTNRSNLINQILAEYLSIQTPEMRVKEIFDFLIHRMHGQCGFKIQTAPSDFMIAIKSPLAYKYRPTIKYSVELYRSHEDQIGELKVAFRTQHHELLQQLAVFFYLWIGIEKHYLSKYYKNLDVLYEVSEGRFRRRLILPKNNDTIGTEAMSKAIEGYIKIFDQTLKSYLYEEQYGKTEIEKDYVVYLNNTEMIL